MVFVGRRDSLTALRAALDDVRAQKPRALLIEGPAGIGKTTLVEHFLAGLAGVRVLRASCAEFEAELRYGVLDQLERATATAILSDESANELAAGAGVLALLDALQESGPVVLVIDDVQWADRPSLNALLFALRRLGSDRVLALLIARPYEVPHELENGIAERLTLAPLSVDEIRALAEALGVTLPSRMARTLWAHTTGSPLHARALLEDTPVDVWRRPPGELPVPRSFGTIVARRLDACSPAARALVEAVAVLGPRCSLAAAAALAGLQDAADALDETARTGLLVADDLLELNFPHPLVLATVLDQLGPSRRAQLHHTAAMQAADPASRLRHRLAAATGPDAAFAAELETFAEQAADRGDGDQAADALVSASRLTPDPALAGDRLVRAVDWMLLVGDVTRAAAFAGDLVTLPGGPRRDGALGFIELSAGDVRKAADLLGSAWEAVDAEAHPRLAALIAHRRGFLALLSLDDPEVVRWAGLARALAPEDPRSAEWNGMLPIALWRLGRRAEAYASLATAWQGTSQIESQLRGMRGWLSCADDRLAAGREDLEAAIESELRHGAVWIAAIHLTTLARACYAAGAWEDAVVAAERAHAIATGLGAVPPRAFVWWAALAVPAARGDWESLGPYLQGAAAEPTDTPDRIVAVGMAQAMPAVARGDAQAVLTALTPVATLSARSAVDAPGFWPWQDHYADALVSTGDLAAAEAFLAPQEALAEERGSASMCARLARVRGRLEAATGDRARARTAFDAALERIIPLGMPYERALIELAYGQFLRREGQRRAAADQLERALQTFTALGALPALERTERELIACGRPAAKRSGHDAAPRLTPQEQAVARLVASGRSNRDVAAELLLSVKTVEVHLTRVYAKLGISNRTELATHVVAQR